MGSSTDDFGKLVQLLKVKRYEQPPPRFFSDFSSQVLARLEDGDQASEPESSFGRWLSQFGLSPVPAFACALIACGLVLYGVALSLHSNVAVTEIPLDPSTIAGQDALSAEAQPGTLSRPASQFSSSNPVMQTDPMFMPVHASFAPPPK